MDLAYTLCGILACFLAYTINFQRIDAFYESMSSIISLSLSLCPSNQKLFATCSPSFKSTASNCRNFRSNSLYLSFKVLFVPYRLSWIKKGMVSQEPLLKVF